MLTGCREREQRDWSSDLNQLPGRAAAAWATIIQWPGSLISPVTSSAAIHRGPAAAIINCGRG